jgi:2-phosphoglycerate kinase
MMKRRAKARNRNDGKETMVTSARTWQVLLLGGASGTGKTSVSYRLARYFAVALTEIDDFQIVLEHMTTPEQQPVLHYWRTHPEAAQFPPERIVEQLIAVGEVMAPAIAAVVVNHLETRTPLVMEGDFILPALLEHPAIADAARAGAVRAVFMYEPDEAQLLRNFAQREPESGLQHKRARVSWLYGQWLKQEAERRQLVALPARPWPNVLERIVAALGTPDDEA